MSSSSSCSTSGTTSTYDLLKVTEKFNDVIHRLKTLIEMVKRERSRTLGSTSSENQPDMIRKLAEVIEMENYGMNLMVEMTTTYYLKEMKVKNKKKNLNSRTSRRQPRTPLSLQQLKIGAPFFKKWQPTEFFDTEHKPSLARSTSWTWMDV